MKPELIFDTNDTQKYLKLLDPNSSAFTWQWFKDNKNAVALDPRIASINFHKKFDDRALEVFQHINLSGRGIFVTVNETDGRGRKAKNLKRIRAVWGEFDNGAPADLPLLPSMIVGSSPGKYHYYWLIDDEMSVEEFQRTMNHLVCDYGSDPNATDLTRVLRLPGFYHMKGEPYRVRLLEAAGNRYLAKEIVSAFCTSNSEMEPHAKRANKPIDFNIEEIEEVLRFIDSEEYQIWVKVGMALHHATLGDDTGLILWDEWSQGSQKYNADEMEYKWSTFSSPSNNPVTLGSLYHLAKLNGWTRSRSPEYHDQTQDLAVFEAADDIEFDERDMHWPEVDRSDHPLKKSQRNILYFLDQLGVNLYFDEFQGKYFIEGHRDYYQLDDQALRDLRLTADALRLQVPQRYFDDVVLNCAYQEKRHPVRDYLERLEWDGIPRIETWLIDYAGAEDTELNRAIGKIWLVAAVRRIFEPGCKFDILLILEGKQGVGKSSLARVMASNDWFEDNLHIGADPKIVMEQTSGKWVIEFSELSGIKNRDVEIMKAMISRQSDNARPAFGRTAVTAPRQFVFVGTTNSSEYLRDTTGNRRFVPVEVTDIDLEALKKDRDQLWAEAMEMAILGEPISLPEELWEDAALIQEDRQLQDPAIMAIEAALDDWDGIIAIEELYKIIGLGPDKKNQRTRYHKDLIGKAMAKLGWGKTRRRHRNSDRIYAYMKDIDTTLELSWLFWDEDSERIRMYSK